MEDISVTKPLSEYAAGLTYNDIPLDVIENIKLHFLDSLGVTIAGSTQDVSQKCLNTFLSLSNGFSGKSLVVGSKYRLPAPWAAFINGTSAHSIELDDGRIGSQVHPGAIIIPTVLSLGSTTNGKRVLESVVLGYEITFRLGMSLFPNHRRVGFHPTGTCGTFGAAVAASKMLCLDSAKIINALAYAGTQAIALRKEDDKNSFYMKKIHAGKAAHNGILAAFMASNDMQGPKSIFEGEDGFLRLIGNGGKPKVIVDGIGTKYVLKDSYYKPYAACRHIHSPIDSLLSIKKEHDFDHENIERIVVRIYKEGLCYSNQKPATPTEAQFSIPYSLAVSLIDGTALLDQYTQERMYDSNVMDLASKVFVEVDETFDIEYTTKKIYANEVIVYLTDGNVFQASSYYPKGTPENPMSQQDVINKFSSLAERVFSQKRIKDIVDIVLHLEDVTKLSLLESLLEK